MGKMVLAESYERYDCFYGRAFDFYRNGIIKKRSNEKPFTCCTSGGQRTLFPRNQTRFIMLFRESHRTLPRGIVDGRKVEEPALLCGRADFRGDRMCALRARKHFLVGSRYGRRPNPTPNPNPTANPDPDPKRAGNRDCAGFRPFFYSICGPPK